MIGMWPEPTLIDVAGCLIHGSHSIIPFYVCQVGSCGLSRHYPLQGFRPFIRSFMHIPAPGTFEPTTLGLTADPTFI